MKGGIIFYLKLIIDDDLKNHWNVKEKIAGVYILTNIHNNKKYVGQTKNVRKRFSDYNGKSKINSSNRPIYSDIKKYGSDSFIFEFIPFDITVFDSLYQMEEYYIKKFDTIRAGYNECNASHNNDTNDSSLNKSLGHTGLKDLNEAKRNKSNKILAIDLKSKKIIISDSGKLFGDYVNKSKDYIKNALRQPSKINNYNLFYLNKSKNMMMINKMKSKRSIRNKDYYNILNYLVEIEIKNESVETIYELLSKKYNCDLYLLRYENIYDNNSLYLTDMTIPCVISDKTGTV